MQRIVSACMRQVAYCPDARLARILDAAMAARLRHRGMMAAPCQHSGAATVQPWCWHGAAMVQPWCSHGAAMVLARCWHGAAMVQPWCWHGAGIPLLAHADGRMVRARVVRRVRWDGRGFVVDAEGPIVELDADDGVRHEHAATLASGARAVGSAAPAEASAGAGDAVASGAADADAVDAGREAARPAMGDAPAHGGETSVSGEATGAQGRGPGAGASGEAHGGGRPGAAYRLSDEIDENGRQFVLAKDGGVAFGAIGAETGLPPAPILLSEGMVTNPATMDGYGLAHIEARHGEQIRRAGFASVPDFVETVARNYDTIRKGRDRDGKQTYIIQMTDANNNTLMVELSGDGTYWNVNTAGVFRTSYGARRDVVYGRHATASQPAGTGGASLSGEQRGTAPSTRMDAPTGASFGWQRYEEKRRWRRKSLGCAAWCCG